MSIALDFSFYLFPSYIVRYCNILTMRKKLKICQLFGKKKKMFSSYSFLSIFSNFSFIWSMEDELLLRRVSLGHSSNIIYKNVLLF